MKMIRWLQAAVGHNLEYIWSGPIDLCNIPFA